MLQGFIVQGTCKPFSPIQHAHPFGSICPHGLLIFLLTDSHGGKLSSQATGTARSCARDPFGGRPLPECLDKEVQFYRDNTVATSTNRTYMAQRLAYFEFCTKVKISPLSLPQADLGRYIAYLSRGLCFSSIDSI